MRVRVLSRLEVENGGAEGADANVSIRSSIDGDEPELNLALAQASRGESARLLRLVVDDIGIPGFERFLGPTMSQIAVAIEFGRQAVDGRSFFDGPVDDPLIAVHCEHGKSRSSAFALALLADHLGVGNEHDAVNTLLRGDVEGRFHPNPLAVSLADDFLLRYGRIDAALLELCPRYMRWKELWRDIAMNPAPYAEKIRRVLHGRGRRSG